MTNLVGPIPPLKDDVLTTTNNGQGLNTIIYPVQDGAGNNSAISLSTIQFAFNGGLFLRRTAITQAQSPYSALTTDYLIAVTTNTSGVTVVLPEANLLSYAPGYFGNTFLIVDEVGNAAAQNITVSAGASTVHGGLINTNYGRAAFYSNGVAWFQIA